MGPNDGLTLGSARGVRKVREVLLFGSVERRERILKTDCGMSGKLKVRNWNLLWLVQDLAKLSATESYFQL